MNNSEFQERVFKMVKLIPFGKVTTYGQIARAMGSPGASRAVGNALHKNPEPVVIPCHRVVGSSGALSENFAFGGKRGQKSLLEQEGVEVKGGKVDLDQYGFVFW